MRLKLRLTKSRKYFKTTLNKIKESEISLKLKRLRRFGKNRQACFDLRQSAENLADQSKYKSSGYPNIILIKTIRYERNL